MIEVVGGGVGSEEEAFANWLMSDLVPIIEAWGSENLDAFYHSFAALAAMLVSRNGLTPQELGDIAFNQATHQQSFQNQTKETLN